MSQFSTETTTMQSASTHVATVKTEIDSLLASLRSEAESVRGFWKGSAAMSFTDLMARYDASTKKLNQALQGIGEQINASGKDYSQTDDVHRANLSNIASSLNV